MDAEQKSYKDINLTPIQTFYKGTNVFITGATGFLGSLLVEKLLRSCSQVSTVFILIRGKKGKTMNDRLNELLNDVLFTKLRSQCPNFREKVIAIEGDCCLPELGISEQDQRLLIDQVNVIFHVAATVKFNEHIKTATNINVKAPLYLLEMARNMKNLKCFMHVSTAYSHCTRDTIEEEIYPAPIESDGLINITQELNDEVLNNITPQLLGKWPNTYTFTKAVTESGIAKKAKGLPVGIFRPAIIISTLQEPIISWINNLYGPTAICTASGLGLLRVLYCKKHVNANLIPGDMCANALIMAAYKVGTDYEKFQNDPINQELPVFHYESSTDQPIDWLSFGSLNFKYGLNYPFNAAIWCSSLWFIEHKYPYWIAFFVLQVLPAAIFDFCLLCLRKPPKLLKAYKKMYEMNDMVAYFAMKAPKFHSNNIRDLMYNHITRRDRDLFFCDLRKFNWDDYFQSYVKGIRVYLLRDDMSTVINARIKQKRYFIADGILKIFLILVFLRLLWSLLSYVNQYIQ